MTGATWDDIKTTVGCTYRQFDVWASAGLIHATWTPGTGNVRTLPLDEVHVLRLLAELVKAGVAPKAAAPLARQLAEVDVGTLGRFNVSRAAS